MRSTIWFKFTAGLLVLLFVLNDIGQAAPALDLSATLRTEIPHVSHIEIPPEMATLEDWYESPRVGDTRLMLHIQDAHAQPEAQARTRDLIHYLNKQYGFKTVFVEGAAEQLDVKWLHPFKNPEQNKRWVDEKASSGEMSGVDLALLDEVAGLKALPIETIEGYRGGYQKLRAVYSKEAEVESFLSFLDSKLDLAASKILDDATRSILSEWKKFESGHRDFLPFVEKLAALAKEDLKLDLNAIYSQIEWPQLCRLLVLQRVEKELDAGGSGLGTQASMRALAVDEKARLLEVLIAEKASAELIQSLKRFDEKNLNLNRITVGDGRQFSSPRALVERLVEETRKFEIDLRDYPAFLKYAGYLILRGELQPSLLFKEIERLFEKLLEKTSGPSNELGASQRPTSNAQESVKLIDIYRDSFLLKKLLNLELSREEWQKAISRRDSISPQNLLESLKLLSGQSLAGQAQSQSLKPSAFVSAAVIPAKAGVHKLSPLTSVFLNAFDFYDAALARENIFFEKISSALAQNDKAILITGGFHTEGMNEFFREKEISYGTLTPRVTNLAPKSLYRNAMMKAVSSPDISSQPAPALAQPPEVITAMTVLSADGFRSENRLAAVAREMVSWISAMKEMSNPNDAVEIEKIIMEHASLFDPSAEGPMSSTPQLITHQLDLTTHNINAFQKNPLTRDDLLNLVFGKEINTKNAQGMPGYDGADDIRDLFYYLITKEHGNALLGFVREYLKLGADERKLFLEQALLIKQVTDFMSHVDLDLDMDALTAFGRSLPVIQKFGDGDKQSGGILSALMRVPEVAGRFGGRSEVRLVQENQPIAFGETEVLLPSFLFESPGSVRVALKIPAKGLTLKSLRNQVARFLIDTGLLTDDQRIVLDGMNLRVDAVPDGEWRTVKWTKPGDSSNVGLSSDKVLTRPNDRVLSSNLHSYRLRFVQPVSERLKGAADSVKDINSKAMLLIMLFEQFLNGVGLDGKTIAVSGSLQKNETYEFFKEYADAYLGRGRGNVPVGSGRYYRYFYVGDERVFVLMDALDELGELVGDKDIQSKSQSPIIMAARDILGDMVGRSEIRINQASEQELAAHVQKIAADFSLLPNQIEAVIQAILQKRGNGFVSREDFVKRMAGSVAGVKKPFWEALSQSLVINLPRATGISRRQIIAAGLGLTGIAALGVWRLFTKPQSRPTSSANLSSTVSAVDGYVLFKNHAQISGLQETYAKFSEQIKQFRAQYGADAKILVFVESMTPTESLIDVARAKGFPVSDVRGIRQYADQLKPFYYGLLYEEKKRRDSGVQAQLVKVMGLENVFTERRYTEVYQKLGPNVVVEEEVVPFEIWLEFFESQKESSDLLAQYLDIANKKIKPDFFKPYIEMQRRYWNFQRKRDEAFAQMMKVRVEQLKPHAVLTERGYDHRLTLDDALLSQAGLRVRVEDLAPMNERRFAVVRRLVDAVPVPVEDLLRLYHAEELHAQYYQALDSADSSTRTQLDRIERSILSRIWNAPLAGLENLAVQHALDLQEMNSLQSPMMKAMQDAIQAAMALQEQVLQDATRTSQIEDLYQRFFNAYQKYWTERVQFYPQWFETLQRMGFLTQDEVDVLKPVLGLSGDAQVKSVMEQYTLAAVLAWIEHAQRQGTNDFIQSLNRSESRFTKVSSPNRSEMRTFDQAMDAVLTVAHHDGMSSVHHENMRGLINLVSRSNQAAFLDELRYQAAGNSPRKKIKVILSHPNPDFDAVVSAVSEAYSAWAALTTEERATTIVMPLLFNDLPGSSQWIEPILKKLFARVASHPDDEYSDLLKVVDLAKLPTDSDATVPSSVLDVLKIAIQYDQQSFVDPDQRVIQVTLIDFNDAIAPSGLKGVLPAVTRIVDHHKRGIEKKSPDEIAHPKATEMRIYSNGSSSTLAALHALGLNELLLESDLQQRVMAEVINASHGFDDIRLRVQLAIKEQQVPLPLQFLMMLAILVDTDNFKNEDTVKPVDVIIYEALRDSIASAVGNTSDVFSDYLKLIGSFLSTRVLNNGFESLQTDLSSEERDEKNKTILVEKILKGDKKPFKSDRGTEFVFSSLDLASTKDIPNYSHVLKMALREVYETLSAQGEYDFIVVRLAFWGDQQVYFKVLDLKKTVNMSALKEMMRIKMRYNGADPESVEVAHGFGQVPRGWMQRKQLSGEILAHLNRSESRAVSIIRASVIAAAIGISFIAGSLVAQDFRPATRAATEQVWEANRQIVFGMGQWKVLAGDYQSTDAQKMIYEGKSLSEIKVIFDTRRGHAPQVFSINPNGAMRAHSVQKGRNDGMASTFYLMRYHDQYGKLHDNALISKVHSIKSESGKLVLEVEMTDREVNGYVGWGPSRAQISIYPPDRVDGTLRVDIRRDAIEGLKISDEKTRLFEGAFTEFVSTNQSGKDEKFGNKEYWDAEAAVFYDAQGSIILEKNLKQVLAQVPADSGFRLMTAEGTDWVPKKVGGVAAFAVQSQSHSPAHQSKSMPIPPTILVVPHKGLYHASGAVTYQIGKTNSDWDNVNVALQPENIQEAIAEPSTVTVYFMPGASKEAIDRIERLIRETRPARSELREGEALRGAISFPIVLGLLGALTAGVYVSMLAPAIAGFAAAAFFFLPIYAGARFFWRTVVEDKTFSFQSIQSAFLWEWKLLARILSKNVSEIVGAWWLNRTMNQGDLEYDFNILREVGQIDSNIGAHFHKDSATGLMRFMLWGAEDGNGRVWEYDSDEPFRIRRVLADGKNIYFEVLKQGRFFPRHEYKVINQKDFSLTENWSVSEYRQKARFVARAHRFVQAKMGDIRFETRLNPRRWAIYELALFISFVFGLVGLAAHWIPVSFWLDMQDVPNQIEIWIEASSKKEVAVKAVLSGAVLLIGVFVGGVLAFRIFEGLLEIFSSLAKRPALIFHRLMGWSGIPDLFYLLRAHSSGLSQSMLDRLRATFKVAQEEEEDAVPDPSVEDETAEAVSMSAQDLEISLRQRTRAWLSQNGGDQKRVLYIGDRLEDIFAIADFKPESFMVVTQDDETAGVAERFLTGQQMGAGIWDRSSEKTLIVLNDNEHETLMQMAGQVGAKPFDLIVVHPDYEISRAELALLFDHGQPVMLLGPKPNLPNNFRGVIRRALDANPASNSAQVKINTSVVLNGLIEVSTFVRSEVRISKESIVGLTQALSRYVPNLIEVDSLSDNPPDLFLLAGNPNFKVFERFVEIYKRDWLDKNIPILVAGGIGRGTPDMLVAVKALFPDDFAIAQLTDQSSEAEILKLFLVKRGISENLITVEGQSPNTEANYRNSKEKISLIFEKKKIKETPNIFIVTDPPLLKRAKLTADRIFNSESVVWNMRGMDLGKEISLDFDALEQLAVRGALSIEQINQLFQFAGYVAGFHGVILMGVNGLSRFGEANGIVDNINNHPRFSEDEKEEKVFAERKLIKNSHAVRDALFAVYQSALNNDYGVAFIEAKRSAEIINLRVRSELRMLDPEKDLIQGGMSFNEARRIVSKNKSDSYMPKMLKLVDSYRRPVRWGVFGKQERFYAQKLSDMSVDELKQQAQDVNNPIHEEVQKYGNFDKIVRYLTEKKVRRGVALFSLEQRWMDMLMQGNPENMVQWFGKSSTPINEIPALVNLSLYRAYLREIIYRWDTEAKERSADIFLAQFAKNIVDELYRELFAQGVNFFAVNLTEYAAYRSSKKYPPNLKRSFDVLTKVFKKYNFDGLGIYLKDETVEENRFDIKFFQKIQAEVLRREEESLQEDTLSKTLKRNVRSEMRLEPAQRSQLVEALTPLMGFLSEGRRYSLNPRSSMRESSQASQSVAWDEIANLPQKDLPDAVLFFGSRDDQVPALAIPVLQKLLARKSGIKIITTGKWSDTHTVLTGNFKDDSGARIAEAEHFARILEKELGVEVIREPNSTNTGENISMGRRAISPDSAVTKRIKVLAVAQPAHERRVGVSVLRQWLKQEELTAGDYEVELIAATPKEIHREDIEQLGDEDLMAMAEIASGEIKRLFTYPESGFTVAIDIPDEIHTADFYLNQTISQIGQVSTRSELPKEMIPFTNLRNALNQGTYDAIQNIRDAIAQTELPLEIILFGSYADGYQVAGSDLDIVFNASARAYDRNRESISGTITEYLSGLGYRFDMKHHGTDGVIPSILHTSPQDFMDARGPGKFFRKEANKTVWVVSQSSVQRINLLTGDVQVYQFARSEMRKKSSTVKPAAMKQVEGFVEYLEGALVALGKIQVPELRAVGTKLPSAIIFASYLFLHPRFGLNLERVMNVVAAYLEYRNPKIVFLNPPKISPALKKDMAVVDEALIFSGVSRDWVAAVSGFHYLENFVRPFYEGLPPIERSRSEVRTVYLTATHVRDLIDREFKSKLAREKNATDAFRLRLLTVPGAEREFSDSGWRAIRSHLAETESVFKLRTQPHTIAAVNSAGVSLEIIFENPVSISFGNQTLFIKKMVWNLAKPIAQTSAQFRSVWGGLNSENALSVISDHNFENNIELKSLWDENRKEIPSIEMSLPRSGYENMTDEIALELGYSTKKANIFKYLKSEDEALEMEAQAKLNQQVSVPKKEEPESEELIQSRKAWIESLKQIVNRAKTLQFSPAIQGEVDHLFTSMPVQVRGDNPEDRLNPNRLSESSITTQLERLARMVNGLTAREWPKVNDWKRAEKSLKQNYSNARIQLSVIQLYVDQMRRSGMSGAQKAESWKPYIETSLDRLKDLYAVLKLFVWWRAYSNQGEELYGEDFINQPSLKGQIAVIDEQYIPDGSQIRGQLESLRKAFQAIPVEVVESRYRALFQRWLKDIDSQLEAMISNSTDEQLIGNSQTRLFLDVATSMVAITTEYLMVGENRRAPFMNVVGETSKLMDLLGYRGVVTTDYFWADEEDASSNLQAPEVRSEMREAYAKAVPSIAHSIFTSTAEETASSKIVLGDWFQETKDWDGDGGVMLLKPQFRFTDNAIATVLNRLLELGLYVDAAVAMEGSDIKSMGLMDRHYWEAASIANLGRNSEYFSAADEAKLKEILIGFGLDEQQLVTLPELLKSQEISEDELDQLLAKELAAGRVLRVGSGKYISKLNVKGRDVAVMNGHYIGLKKQFELVGKKTIALRLRMLPGRVTLDPQSWKMLIRDGLLGSTDPTKAGEDTLRGMLRDGKLSYVGKPVTVDGGSNGFHLSDEAMVKQSTGDISTRLYEGQIWFAGNPVFTGRSEMRRGQSGESLTEGALEIQSAQRMVALRPKLVELAGNLMQVRSLKPAGARPGLQESARAYLQTLQQIEVEQPELKGLTQVLVDIWAEADPQPEPIEFSKPVQTLLIEAAQLVQKERGMLRRAFLKKLFGTGASLITEHPLLRDFTEHLLMAWRLNPKIDAFVKGYVDKLIADEVDQFGLERFSSNPMGYNRLDYNFAKMEAGWLEHDLRQGGDVFQQLLRGHIAQNPPLFFGELQRPYDPKFLEFLPEELRVAQLSIPREEANAEHALGMLKGWRGLEKRFKREVSAAREAILSLEFEGSSTLEEPDVDQIESDIDISEQELGDLQQQLLEWEANNAHLFQRLLVEAYYSEGFRDVRQIPEFREYVEIQEGIARETEELRRLQDELMKLTFETNLSSPPPLSAIVDHVTRRPPTETRSEMRLSFEKAYETLMMRLNDIQTANEAVTVLARLFVDPDLDDEQKMSVLMSLAQFLPMDQVAVMRDRVKREHPDVWKQFSRGAVKPHLTREISSADLADPKIVDALAESMVRAWIFNSDLRFDWVVRGEAQDSLAAKLSSAVQKLALGSNVKVKYSLRFSPNGIDGIKFEKGGVYSAPQFNSDTPRNATFVQETWQASELDASQRIRAHRTAILLLTQLAQSGSMTALLQPYFNFESQHLELSARGLRLALEEIASRIEAATAFATAA